MNVILSQIVSFVLGIVASFLAWFFLSRLIRPKLLISDKISKLKALAADENDSYQYRIKVENRSMYNVYDIIMQARLVVLGVVEGHPEMQRRFKINVGIGTVTYLCPTKKRGDEGRQFIVNLAVAKDPKKSRLRRLYCEQFGKENNEETRFGLEEALTIGKRAYIELSMVCTHEFSGARRVFHKRYEAGDIEVDKTFAKFGVNIDPTRLAVPSEDDAE